MSHQCSYTTFLRTHSCCVCIEYKLILCMSGECRPQLTHWGRDKWPPFFQTTFSNAFSWMKIKISLKFVPKGPISNNPALVQIMARRRSGDKPLSEPMMVSLLTHICVTRPQWVKKSEVHHSILWLKLFSCQLTFLGWGAVFYSSLSITQVKFYSSSYLIKHRFPLLNFYPNLTRKQKSTLIMDFGK